MAIDQHVWTTQVIAETGAPVLGPNRGRLYQCRQCSVWQEVVGNPTQPKTMIPCVGSVERRPEQRGEGEG